MTVFNDELLKQVMVQIAQDTRAAIERGDAKLKVSIDSNYAELSTKLNGLMDQDLSNQIAILKELLDALDGETVENLLQLKGLAEQALASAIEGNIKSDTTLVKIADLQTTYNEYVAKQGKYEVSIANELSSLQESVTILRACCETAIKESDVIRLIEENNNLFYKACTAAGDAFSTIMNKTGTTEPVTIVGDII
jgi:uncharacterized FlgJ-related protein